MGKQLLCALTIAIMTVGMVIPAEAAESPGQIRVMLDFEDGEVHDGEVTLYRAGKRVGDCYRLEPAFGGGLVKEADARSEALAYWLSETVTGEGEIRILDADGTAWYSGLEEGLYLLVQSSPSEGLDPVPPMLLTVPFSGQWELVALPQYQAIQIPVPETGQHASPLIGAMGMVLSGLALYLCLERLRQK